MSHISLMICGLCFYFYLLKYNFVVMSQKCLPWTKLPNLRCETSMKLSYAHSLMRRFINCALRQI
jgi:hypothetical protein